jgi:thymidylate synthase
MVNAWNVGELDQMVLPPCHYGFQVYTRELSIKERMNLCREKLDDTDDGEILLPSDIEYRMNNYWNIPTRAISLMFNMRSTDVGLGLSFNLGSYGLLLTILSKIVNMVPDELIYNGGDVHLYSNHIEPIKEQLNRKPYELPTLNIMKTDDFWKNFDVSLFNHLDVNDFVIENYKSHPPIKLILSN